MTQNSQIFIGQNCHFELHLATDGKPDSFHYVSFSVSREKISSVKNMVYFCYYCFAIRTARTECAVEEMEGKW